jgi:hypothetical protein
MRTSFYVDGFNLYYGCVKGTPFKWLDLERLCQLSFPHDHVHRIRYFTAIVKARPHDSTQPVRQQVFLRAIQTLPCVSVHLGHYLQSRVTMPLAFPPVGGPTTATVIKSEEKGSDVNLATMLLVDAFDADFEQAVIISNDSDLAVPVGIVQTKFGLPVHVLFPCSNHGRKPSYHLSHVAASSKFISGVNLAAAQFPTPMKDHVGTFHKPASW